MRKRSITHVAKTVFWYVLYFLPVLAYLIFVMSNPFHKDVDNSIEYPVVPEYTETAVMTIAPGALIDLQSTADISNRTQSYFTAYLQGAYYVDDVRTMVKIPFIVCDKDYTNVAFDTEWNFCYFDFTNMSNTTPIKLRIPSQLVGYSSWTCWYNTMLRNNNVGFIYQNFTTYSTEYVLESLPVETLTYDFESFVNALGFEFATDNIIVNSLENIFGASGVLPLFKNDTPFIIFGWYICVFLLHLVVDFLMFIPKFAHKWMEEFVGD